jgi:deoxyribodipyrimidine photolyase
MRSWSRHAMLLLALTSIPLSVSAQIDRARGEVYADFTRYYNEMVKYAEDEKRDEALKSSDDMAKALQGMFDVSKDAPSRLNDAGLRDLGSQAQAFLDAIQSFRNRGSNFQDKLKRVGESYSSELSDLKSAFDKLRETFNVLWGNLQRAGQGVKAVCERGCF